MSFEGKLEHFNITEIMQMIGMKRASGVLDVRSPEGNIRFVIKDGAIVDVNPDERSKKQLIGEMLVDAGVISEKERDRILKEQKRKKKKFGELLLERKKIDENLLSRFLKIQIKECFFKTLTYRKGTYSFDAFDVTYEGPLKEPVDINSLLMEGVQFLDEIPRITEKIPLQGILVRRREVPNVKQIKKKDENAFRLYGIMEEFDEPIKHFRRCGLSEFEGYKALAALMDLKALEVTRVKEFEEKTEKKEEVASRVRGIKFSSYLNAVLSLILIGGACFAIYDTIRNSGIFLVLREIFKGF